MFNYELALYITETPLYCTRAHMSSEDISYLKNPKSRRSASLLITGRLVLGGNQIAPEISLCNITQILHYLPRL